jgi:hypothetical protein
MGAMVGLVVSCFLQAINRKISKRNSGLPAWAIGSISDKIRLKMQEKASLFNGIVRQEAGRWETVMA